MVETGRNWREKFKSTLNNFLFVVLSKQAGNLIWGSMFWCHRYVMNFISYATHTTYMYSICWHSWLGLCVYMCLSVCSLKGLALQRWVCTLLKHSLLSEQHWWQVYPFYHHYVSSLLKMCECLFAVFIKNNTPPPTPPPTSPTSTWTH